VTERALTKRLALTAGAGAVALAGWVGWFEPARAWPRATGWSRIPGAERPADDRLWRPVDGGEAPPELRWLGHAGFLLRWRGVTLLLDPNTSPRCTIAKRTLEPARPASRLGPVDAALVSHAHYDHLDLPTLEAVPELAAVVVPRGAEASLPPALRRRATVVAEGSSVRFGELEVVAVRARHNGNRHHPLASRELAVGYVVRSPENALYYAGDTGFGDHFADVAEKFHPRVAILPIGAYSPRWILAPHHLSPEEAVTAAEVLGVETAVPAHFGTFTLFFDRPSSALPRFARAAHRRGVRWVMPELLTP
jgi:L-ascorbate metabolism protein UlaG (beta-lactamase superfamily)